MIQTKKKETNLKNNHCFIDRLVEFEETIISKGNDFLSAQKVL